MTLWGEHGRRVGPSSFSVTPCSQSHDHPASKQADKQTLEVNHYASVGFASLALNYPPHAFPIVLGVSSTMEQTRCIAVILLGSLYICPLHIHLRLLIVHTPYFASLLPQAFPIVLGMSSTMEQTLPTHLRLLICTKFPHQTLGSEP